MSSGNPQSETSMDDFIYYDQPCGTAGSCDFESRDCTWQNTAAIKQNVHWVSGRGPQGVTGPKADHTTGSSTG